MNSRNFFSQWFRSFSRPDPKRDWHTALLISAMLLAGIIVGGVWAFDTVARGGIIGAPLPPASSVMNQASLEAIHAIFADRAAEEAKYVSGVYRFSDPSL